jgi:hypothetical protein
MKYIKKMTACRRAQLACVLVSTLALASCGGGGGSAAPVTSSNIIASFLDIIPGLNFSWSTSQQGPVGIVLSRASGGAAGDLSVVIAKYSCIDPTGGAGLLPHPVHLDNYLLYPLTADQQQQKTPVTLNLAALNVMIPAATNTVLVEVLDNNDPSLELYSKLVAPADLPTLNIVIPLPQLRDATGRALDSSPSPLASCANPG